MANFSYDFAGGGAFRADSIVVTGNVSGARFLAGDGTQALPAYAYAADPDTGLYRDASNSNRIVAGGTVTQTSTAGQTLVGASLFIQQYLQLTGAFIETFRAVDVATVGAVIAVGVASSNVRVTMSAGSIASTAAAFLADGADGQEIWLHRSTDAGVLTLSDEATIAGTNLRLVAATIALGPRDVVGFKWNPTVADWVQIAPVCNIL